MNNNDLLTLLIAFVLGYFAHQMMRQMCRGGLLEGSGHTVYDILHRYDQPKEKNEDGQIILKQGHICKPKRIGVSQVCEEGLTCMQYVNPGQAHRANPFHSCEKF